MARLIEIRRHAQRIPPAEHLSQEGVSAARRVGQGMGRFDAVVSSPAVRAWETAIAMGFAVTQAAPQLESYGVEVEGELPWPQPFQAYQQAHLRRGPAWRFMRGLAEFYRRLAADLPDGGAALVLSHGGIVEMSAVACLPQAGYDALGAHVACCEGVRLQWVRDAFTSLEILRL